MTAAARMDTRGIHVAIGLFFALSAFFCAGVGVGQRWGESRPEAPDTLYVTRWQHDTIREAGSVRVETRVVYLAMHDTTAVHDTTTVRDSVLVEVPITERHYAGENYRATVRGYQAELTDIWVQQRETRIREPYRKRWTLTAGPQAGVGITPDGWRPYAGAGITFGYSF